MDAKVILTRPGLRAPRPMLLMQVGSSSARPPGSICVRARDSRRLRTLSPKMAEGTGARGTHAHRDADPRLASQPPGALQLRPCNLPLPLRNTSSAAPAHRTVAAAMKSSEASQAGTSATSCFMPRRKCSFHAACPLELPRMPVPHPGCQSSQALDLSRCRRHLKTLCRTGDSGQSFRRS